jgi:hypothetical protein
MDGMDGMDGKLDGKLRGNSENGNASKMDSTSLENAMEKRWVSNGVMLGSPTFLMIFPCSLVPVGFSPPFPLNSQIYHLVI